MFSFCMFPCMQIKVGYFSPRYYTDYRAIVLCIQIWREDWYLIENIVYFFILNPQIPLPNHYETSAILMQPWF